MKKGKRYINSAKLVDKARTNDIDNAMELVEKTASAQFDETVE